MSIDEQVLRFYQKTNGNLQKSLCSTLRITKDDLFEILSRNNLEIKDPNFPLYKKIYQVDNKFCINRPCPECHKNVVDTTTTRKSDLIRNYKRKVSKNTLCFRCSKLNEKNSFFNKHHKQDTIIKISKNRTGKGCGQNNAMARPENRKKVSDALQYAWSDGKLDHLKKESAARMLRTHRAGKIKNLPSSKVEKKILEQLKMFFDNVEKQKIIETKRFDFYIPLFNLLIEYNGDYWHCNPKKYPATFYHKKKKMFAWELWDYDKQKIKIAIAAGYNCITIWESEYTQNPDLLFQKINEYK